MSESNTDATRALLAQVKQQIASKNYDQAHWLLLRVDHPKREQWLAQLEKMRQEDEQEKYPKPWNPFTVAALGMIISPIIATLVLAWNWQHMGKGRWVWPTVISGVLILFAFITPLTLIGAVDTSGGVFDGPIITYFVAGVFALANRFFPAFISMLQMPVYKAYQQGGLRAGRAQKLNWIRATSLYMGMVLLIVAGIAIFSISRLQPREFNDGLLAVTIPAGWQEYNVNEADVCDDGYLTCHLLLAQGPSHMILFARINQVDAWMSLTEFMDNYWNRLLDNPKLDPFTSGSYTVNGLDGQFIIYSSTDGIHFSDLVVRVDSEFWYISAITDEENPENDPWRDLDKMLRSIRFLNMSI